MVIDGLARGSREDEDFDFDAFVDHMDMFLAMQFTQYSFRQDRLLLLKQSIKSKKVVFSFTKKEKC